MVPPFSATEVDVSIADWNKRTPTLLTPPADAICTEVPRPENCAYTNVDELTLAPPRNTNPVAPAPPSV